MEHQVITIIAEIFDLPPEDITPTTYLFRDLGAESIDLLEIGVAIQHRLGLPVREDILFLRDLRLHLKEAAERGVAPETALASVYPHLSTERIAEILTDRAAGPVLQVRDLVAYVQHVTQPCASPSPVLAS
jgi:acyl carrier protein